MREAVVEFWNGGDKPTLDNVRDPEWLAQPFEQAHARRATRRHLRARLRRASLPADHHLRLSGRNVAALQEQARRARVRRALRDLRRRHGDRQRLHRVERSAGAAPPLRDAARNGGTRRRRSASHGRGLPARALLRHAADRRRRHRHRPRDDDHDRIEIDPRRHSVSAAAARRATSASRKICAPPNES